jgi:phosphatidylinositol-3-phosphatase
VTLLSRHRALTLAAAVLAAAATACGASSGPTVGPTTASSAQSSTEPSTPLATTTAPSPTAPHSASPGTTRPATSGISKVLVLIVENHSLDTMRQQMPWTFALAQRYGYASGYHAVSHPSLPNYLAISGGDTFGIVDDRSPAAHVLHGASVFGQALAQHRTAKVYVEDMATDCAPYDQGTYAVRHNPWTYYVDEHSACARYDVPMSSLTADVRAGRLPNVGLVVPNTCSDAHDCPLATADGWMKSVVGGIMSGPDFASGRLLVVITADEDHHDQGNLVLTTLVNPQLHGVVVSSALDHYSLSRLLSEVVGAAPLRKAGSAPSMTTAFRLRMGG